MQQSLSHPSRSFCFCCLYFCKNRTAILAKELKSFFQAFSNSPFKIPLNPEELLIFPLLRLKIITVQKFDIIIRHLFNIAQTCFLHKLFLCLQSFCIYEIFHLKRKLINSLKNLKILFFSRFSSYYYNI